MSIWKTKIDQKKPNNNSCGYCGQQKIKYYGKTKEGYRYGFCSRKCMCNAVMRQFKLKEIK